MVDHFHEANREARADEVARTVLQETVRPRSVHGLPRTERDHHLRQGALHQAVRDESRADWHALPRPYEVAHRAAERLMRKARGLGRRHHDGGGHQHPEVLLRPLRLGKSPRTGASGRD